jgi:hypothetical protein
VIELRAEDVNDLNTVAERAEQATEQPVDTRQERPLEVAVAEPQTDLVLSDSDLDAHCRTP